MKPHRLLIALAWVFLVGAGYSVYRWSLSASDLPASPRPHYPSRRATSPDTTRSYPDILVTPAWLRSRTLSSTVLVDARPRERYETGHLPGSISLDPREWNGDPWSLAGWLGSAGVPDRATVVCVSDSLNGAAGGLLFWLLELAGIRDVRVLAGGVEAWQGNGGALEMGSSPVQPRPFRARPDTSRVADYRYVAQVFGRKGVDILDPRPDEAWEAGHIPHSLPSPVDSIEILAGQAPGPLITRSGTSIKAAGALIRLAFQNWGPRENEFIDPGDEIVIGGDVPPDTPLHPYLAARLAGLERVRVYPEGFRGWQARGDLPVVRITDTRELSARLHHEWGPDLPDREPRSFILFDLREAMDYSRGHVPGAVLLPAGQFADSLDVVVARHWPDARPESTPLVTYCYGPGCTRSRNCTTLAGRRGYKILIWYREGMEGWDRAGERVYRGSSWAPASKMRAGGP